MTIVPIAENGSGDFICLDLSVLGKEKVVLWAHEFPNKLFFVAESFENFIDMLTDNPEYI